MATSKFNDEVVDQIDETEEVQEDVDYDPTPDEEVEDEIVKQPFRVVYQTNNFLLPQIRDLVTSNEGINLRPEYQRRLRWSTQQKSLLIESLLLNVPVPPVFFYENDLARYEVMDGQQRLNAIKEFLNGDFSLRGLQIISSLNGRTYSKLPSKVKRSLDRASISAIVLLQESQSKIKKTGSSRSYELRRFVFERLNTGGKHLSAQEIRNAIYGGAFNDEIVQLSRNSTFTRIWGIPKYGVTDADDDFEQERQKNTLYKTMGDCQLVLRFFALDNEDHIHGSMKSMLDRCMERNLDASKAQAESLGKRYLECLELADELFDGNPFSIKIKGRAAHRPVAGIYDGVMISLNDLWDYRDVLLLNKHHVQSEYAELIEANSSTGLLTGSANTAQDIKNRIEMFRTIFVNNI